MSSPTPPPTKAQPRRQRANERTDGTGALQWGSERMSSALAAAWGCAKARKGPGMNPVACSGGPAHGERQATSGGRQVRGGSCGVTGNGRFRVGGWGAAERRRRLSAVRALPAPTECIPSAWSFESSAAMIAGGWDLSGVQLAKETVPLPACTTDPTKWYGWRAGSAVGAVRLRFQSPGVGALDFGNCWTEGVVEVFLNGARVAAAGPRVLSMTRRFAVQVNDVLELRDSGPNSVILLSSLALECKGMASAHTLLRRQRPQNGMSHRNPGSSNPPTPPCPQPQWVGGAPTTKEAAPPTKEHAPPAVVRTTPAETVQARALPTCTMALWGGRWRTTRTAHGGVELGLTHTDTRRAMEGRPGREGEWAATTVKRPPQQPAQPQRANYLAPPTTKAPLTRQRRHEEQLPPRPSERIDPTQHAKGRTGDGLGQKISSAPSAPLTTQGLLGRDPPHSPTPPPWTPPRKPVDTGESGR